MPKSGPQVRVHYRVPSCMRPYHVLRSLAGMPCVPAKRVRLVAPGQIARVFSVDSFRHVLNAVVERYADKGRKLLMHAVSNCQADILLDRRSNDEGIIRLHYFAAAAEMARMYDTASAGKRRGSVVELMGDKWQELNSMAATRPMSRPPSPTYNEMPEGLKFRPIPPPTGAELAYNSMVWLEEDVEVVAGRRVVQAEQAPTPSQQPAPVRLQPKAAEPVRSSKPAKAPEPVREAKPVKKPEPVKEPEPAKEPERARRPSVRAAPHIVTEALAEAPEAELTVRCSIGTFMLMRKFDTVSFLFVDGAS